MSDRQKGYLFGAASLITGIVGVIIVVGLLVGGVNAGNPTTVIAFAILALICLPTAYITNRLGKRLRQ